MTILTSQAADRNAAPILEVLRHVLPAQGNVLEIASGTGQHVEFFATRLSALRWQPSDPDPAARASVDARTNLSGLPNVAPAIDLDILETWQLTDRFDAVIVANLLHISPFATLDALLHGALRILQPGGVLHVYGPFKRAGEHTSIGNAEFDESLRRRNPAWGIRDVEIVLDAAIEAGFVDHVVREMPANNLSLVFIAAEV